MGNARTPSATGGRYAAERYNPRLAHCGRLELRFDGATLVMSGGSKTYRYPAVSGRPTSTGSFDYSPANQRVSNVGPIPEGTYWIRPDQLWEVSIAQRIFAPGVLDSWGSYRITIHPFTTTATFGRGGFFIHGGTARGSAGCIDLTSRIDDFVRDLHAEGATGACQIHLTVDYP